MQFLVGFQSDQLTNVIHVANTVNQVFQMKSLSMHLFMFLVTSRVSAMNHTLNSHFTT